MRKGHFANPNIVSLISFCAIAVVICACSLVIVPEVISKDSKTSLSPLDTWLLDKKLLDRENDFIKDLVGNYYVDKRSMDHIYVVHFESEDLFIRYDFENGAKAGFSNYLFNVLKGSDGSYYIMRKTDSLTVIEAAKIIKQDNTKFEIEKISGHQFAFNDGMFSYESNTTYLRITERNYINMMEYFDYSVISLATEFTP